MGCSGFQRGSRLGRASLLAGLLVLLAGCRHHAPQSEHKPATRVVSVTPSTTEALAAIGARGVLVGRSRYCDYPPDVASVPVVGGFVDPSYEAILALAPDLVTGARGPAGTALTTHLAAQGIATYFPVTESFGGIDDMLFGLGERTGHTSEAARVVMHMHEEEDAVARAVAAVPRVRVLLVFGITPIVAAGPDGFPEEMLTRAGGINVVTQGGGYPTLGLEHVIGLDPDVVINAAWGESSDEGRIGPTSPGWKELRAVKEGRVVALRYDDVLRPGPRIAEGLAKLATVLHPGLTIP